MRRCFVCNSFITLSKTCCVCQKYKGCKFELCPPFLGWDSHVSSACIHEQMAFTSKFSTVNICIMRAYVWMRVIVTRPPDKAVIFFLLINSDTSISSAGITTWWRATCFFFPLALSRQLKSWTVVPRWHFWNTEQSWQVLHDHYFHQLLAERPVELSSPQTIVSLTSEPCVWVIKNVKYARVSFGSSRDCG